MNTFKDATGREWTLSFTVGKIRAVKNACGIDMNGPTNVENVCALISAREDLASVLWQLVKSVAEGMSQDDFCEALDGDALEAGRAALNEAYIAWCPESSRAAVRNTIEKHDAALKQTADAIVERLESPEFNEELGRLIKESFKPVALAV